MAQVHTRIEVKPGRAPADAAPAHGNRSAPRHDVVRTACGREFAVSHLGLEQIAYPAARVTLSTACLPQDHAGIWAGLTPHEARHLAALLLTHAEAAERDPSDAKQIRVDYADAERHTVRIPGQDLVVSERASALGREGDTVADLLAAAVALDIARRTGRFLIRHETRRDGLHITVRTAAPKHATARPHTIAVTVTTPPSLSGEHKSALRTLLRTSVLRNPAWRGLRIEIAVAGAVAPEKQADRL